MQDSLCVELRQIKKALVCCLCATNQKIKIVTVHKILEHQDEQKIMLLVVCGVTSQLAIRHRNELAKFLLRVL